MFARAGTRSARAIQAPTRQALRTRQVRFASDNAGSSSGSNNHALIGGLAGGAAAIGLGYGWYHFSGAKTAVNTMHQTKQYYDGITNNIKGKFQDQTPAANDALNAIKQTALGYAAYVPGGKHYVNKAFEDIDMIKKQHSEEVDNIVREAYGELRDLSRKGGLTLSTATEAWDILSKHLQQLGSLAGDAAQDIANNHPELKQKFGGQFEQLQQLGDRLGPEAKKQVDETWGQIRDITKQGLQWDTADKIRKLVQEKAEKLQKMGDEAWDKGMENVKPMLEKKPEVKKMVEQNMDVLKGGNVTEAVEKVKSAAESGDTGDLQKYVEQ